MAIANADLDVEKTMGDLTEVVHFFCRSKSVFPPGKIIKENSHAADEISITIFMELHVSLSSGISGFKVVISTPAATSIETLSKTSAETAAKRVGLEPEADVEVKLSTDANQESTGAKGKGVDIAVQELLKRMKELQQLLRQQQQQLAAVQAANYPSAEAKTASVMGVQGQIAGTVGALQQVASALAEALSKDSITSSMIDTTA
ncbi:alanyl-tRNA synthetase [Pseudomonas lini]|uniref:hypothetical protein n=1 Tax=Pseudomonas lini TaxID=163011 RepID=UPI002785A096|nr:hypothetical protein [Pseudomonas lini]MDQ0125513.1 alanyl-tRNA synthetase [Pseudomonas lini]